MKFKGLTRSIPDSRRCLAPSTGTCWVQKTSQIKIVAGNYENPKPRFCYSVWGTVPAGERAVRFVYLGNGSNRTVISDHDVASTYCYMVAPTSKDRDSSCMVLTFWHSSATRDSGARRISSVSFQNSVYSLACSRHYYSIINKS